MTKFNIKCTREIQTGHRIYGHKGKCQRLHGHSYVFHFYCTANELDDLGMVVDFAVIKETFGQWLEDNYDHRMLLWVEDPMAQQLQQIDPTVVIVSYNPSAENIAHHLLTEVAPKLLGHLPVVVNKVVVEESSSSSASCEL